MTHLTFEQINDIADGRRSTAEGESRHIGECVECRETLRRIRELIGAAQGLPRDVAPPPEIWTALASRVAARPARARASAWRYGSWIAAAAAVILVAGTLLFAPGRSQRVKAAQLAGSDPLPHASLLVLAVDKNYAATVAELRQTLETQRATLSPATIRVLERSLAAIDTAIAEARDALANDPANQTLVGILSANYQRKVELLQRATQLSSSS